MVKTVSTGLIASKQMTNSQNDFIYSNWDLIILP